MGLFSFLDPAHKPTKLPRYQVFTRSGVDGMVNILGVYETLYESQALDMAIIEHEAKGVIYYKSDLEASREGFF